MESRTTTCLCAGRGGAGGGGVIVGKDVVQTAANALMVTTVAVAPEEGVASDSLSSAFLFLCLHYDVQDPVRHSDSSQNLD